MTGAAATLRRAYAHALTVKSALEDALALGLNGLAEMAEYLNARGVLRDRGGKWRTESVRRVRKYLDHSGQDQFKVRTRSDAQRARFKRRYPRSAMPAMSEAVVRAEAVAYQAYAKRTGRVR